MRERLDCAVLMTQCTEEWANRWLERNKGGRLHFQHLNPFTEAAERSSQSLAAAAMRLRRFDVCLLFVTESNLAWVRTALQAAKGTLQTPLIALAHQLKAPALNDLYTLGLADFVRDPVCAEELRARVERLLDGGRYQAKMPFPMAPHVNEVNSPYATAFKATPQEAAVGIAGEGEAELCASILDRSGYELEAFAVASASRCATSRESFRSAKSKVIERFERAYIKAALGRHSGNIAMAARSAQKHRRAFWALMRKHQIDAAVYREEARQNSI